MTYQPHAVHLPSFGYPETNCWTDVIIELLHSRGLEPLAALGCTVSLDHEGDQLTFFKPRSNELEALFGIDVHELQPYRPIADHVRTALALGRTLIVEVDAWWLPDTVGTSYRTEHVKTAIGIDALDDAQLDYFHNAGRFTLTGEDLDHVFVPAPLPGYVETVRFNAGPCLAGEELRTCATELLRDTLLRRPERSPFAGLAGQLARELDEVLARPAEQVHQFAFATTRMGGAAAALAAEHVRWVCGATDAAAAFDRVSTTTRTLTMRLMRRKSFDPGPLLTSLDTDWTEAQDRLDDLLL